MHLKPVSTRGVLLTWGAFVLVCGAILLTGLRFSYDLGLFLPAPQTTAQQVLVDRLGDSPGARLLLIGLPDADDEQVDAARFALEDSGAFSRVLAGAPSPELSDMPEVIWRYRLLLDDAPITEDSLRRALGDRAADLALFAGADFNTLLREDPGLNAINTLQSLAAGAGNQERWETDDGTAVLMVETTAASFDIGGQALAVQRIRDELNADSSTRSLTPQLSGPGAFAVELRDVIHAEARNRSILASVALALVLLIAYRRPSYLIVAALPLASGALAGLSVVTLVFPAVHGITLAFGFTLLGIALDYPLHVFSHARSADAATAVSALWPTLRLGAVSTVLAYLAIALSGSQGPAQLGLFTAAGLMTAALVTRWLLPRMIRTRDVATESDAPTGITLRWWPPLLVGTIGVALVFGVSGALWNNNLADLSPVPPASLKLDQTFRNAVGTPSLRYVIALRDPRQQTVLEQTEALHAALGDAVNRGLLGDWQAVTQILPSNERFAARQRTLPSEPALRADLAVARAASPFAAGIFEPFIAHVAMSRTLSPPSVDAFAGTPLESFVTGHLYASGGQWVSLVSLFGDVDPDGLATWLRTQATAAELVDFRAASETLVADYRTSTLRMLGIALLLILALLLWRVTLRRAVWSLCVVLSAVAGTTGALFALTGALNLYHLMALLLVAGLGMDYALFLSRHQDGRRARGDTRHAILACAASTSVAFGVLSTSAIPALHSLGATVTVGALLCLVVAWSAVRLQD
ncbi:MAG: MMPL family transporter [Gammaproteobacteria bacterium]